MPGGIPSSFWAGAGRPGTESSDGWPAMCGSWTGPLAGSRAITDSQEDAASGDLRAALAKADDATEIEPYAATPYLQKALVLERLGRLGPAANAARRATRKESTNWKTWLVLSRLEAEAGNAQAAVDAYLEGRRMNPGSKIFRQ